MSAAEIAAVYELERLMHRAAASRFEQVGPGFVAASPSLPDVWDASLVQLEPDRAAPQIDELLELAELPSEWYPELKHRTVFIGAAGGDHRELALSLAKRGWDVQELVLMVTRTNPGAERGAGSLSGAAMKRLKGRLAVEQGLPPRSIAQFDRYDALRERIASRNVYAGLDQARNPAAIADAYLRGDIAMIEDVATLRRQRHRGYATRAVRAATSASIRLGARAVALFAEPDVARGFYTRLGFEPIGGAYDCKLSPSSGLKALRRD